MSDDTSLPQKKSPRPRGPGRKKNEFEPSQDPVGAVSAIAETPGEPPVTDGPGGGPAGTPPRGQRPPKGGGRHGRGGRPPEGGGGARNEGGLKLPTRPVEVPGETTEEEAAAAAVVASGKPALTVNIAKLQAMSMTELNQMAKEMNIENFGTMRKHEVIFHILQKNAERSGILFSEGVHCSRWLAG